MERFVYQFDGLNGFLLPAFAGVTTSRRNDRFVAKGIAYFPCHSRESGNPVFCCLEKGKFCISGATPSNYTFRRKGFYCMSQKGLENEFRKIGKKHKEALKKREATVCFGASTIRVFKPNIKDEIKKVLYKIDIGRLEDIGKNDFHNWFEKNLKKVAKKIPHETSKKKKISDGSRKWGYAAKILNLYLRGIVLGNHYFTYKQVEKIEKLLYVPIDSKIIDAVKEHINLDFNKIKDVNTSEKFYKVQNALGEAALKAGVPRIWFDDKWVDS